MIEQLLLVVTSGVSGLNLIVLNLIKCCSTMVVNVNNLIVKNLNTRFVK